MTLDSPTLGWLIIVVSAIGIYAFRISFIILWDWVDEVPDRLRFALTLVPPAVLATFIVPGVLAPGGTLTLAVENSRLFAAPIAIAVAYRTESILWTLVVGIGALLLWQTVVI